jgi:hypothetical protein
VTARKNGIVTDDERPWTAAAYLRDDTAFAGEQHGVLGSGTLCGLPEESITVVRNPFFGTKHGDCAACAARLNELAK